MPAPKITVELPASAELLVSAGSNELNSPKYPPITYGEYRSRWLDPNYRTKI